MRELKWNNAPKIVDKSDADFEVIGEAPAKKHEDLPAHFLADTPEEALEIYKQFAKDLNFIAQSYSTVTGLEKSDLFGEALVGLGKAKKSFTPNRGCSFRTYAVRCIHSVLEEYVRIYINPVAIPSYLTKASRQLNILRALMLANDIKSIALSDALLRCDVSKLDMNIDAQNRCVEAIENFHAAAARAGIDAVELLHRIALLPTHIDYDESTDVCGAFIDEESKLNAAIAVEEMRQEMTKAERFVADGIMAGKTEKEIAESHDPPRSRSWVSKTIRGLREKFGDASWS
jgi:RNA polymerase sigma factor (sigma-70 family)